VLLLNHEREVRKMFIVVGLFMSITVGGFLSMMFTSGMKDGWKKVVVAIIIAFAIGFGVSGLFALERKGDEMAWNNGHCECGTEWELVDVEHLKNSGELYYYGCDNCGAVIRTHSNFGK
jgi:hypothetical protein